MRNRTLGLVLLGVIAAVDLILIFLAMRPDPKASVAVANDKPAAYTPAAANPSGKPTPQAATAQQISLSLGEGPTALAAVPGTCAAGGAKTLLSTDNGATWKTPEGPAAVVPRVNVTGAGAGFAIGAPTGCTDPQLFRGTEELTAWGAGVPAADTWFLLPTSPAQINGPAGTNASPCGSVATIGIAPSTGSTATTVCADGRTLQTDNGGADWAAKGQLPAPHAIAGTPGENLIALAGADGCAGLAVFTGADGGATWTKTACLAGISTSGPVGIAILDTTAMAIDGNGKTFLSTDAGKTFTAVA